MLFLRKGDYGIHQNCEIWHGASLDTLIIIQEKQFEGPGEDHVLAIKVPYFGHFLEKGTMGYTQICELLHGASLGTLIMIQEELILRTM